MNLEKLQTTIKRYFDTVRADTQGTLDAIAEDFDASYHRLEALAQGRFLLELEQSIKRDREKNQEELGGVETLASLKAALLSRIKWIQKSLLDNRWGPTSTNVMSNASDYIAQETACIFYRVVWPQWEVFIQLCEKGI